MTTGFYLIPKSALPGSMDINQIIQMWQGIGDAGSIYLGIAPLSAPSSALTAAAGSSGGLSGSYAYVVTYVTGFQDSVGTIHVSGETTVGSASTAVSLTSQSTNLSAIPTGPTGTIARNIYRNKSGGSTTTGPWYLVTQIPNNTSTTFVDNVPDASLGAQAPGSNTTGTKITMYNPTFNNPTSATNFYLGNPSAASQYSPSLTLVWTDSSGVQHSSGIYANTVGDIYLAANTTNALIARASGQVATKNNIMDDGASGNVTIAGTINGKKTPSTECVAAAFASGTSVAATGFFGTFHYVAAQWANIQGFLLEVTMAAANTTTSSGQMVDAANQAVTGPQVSTAFNNETTVRSGLITPSTFTDGHDYTLKISSTGASPTVYGACLKAVY